MRAGYQEIGGPCYVSFRGSCWIGSNPTGTLIVQFSDGSIYRYFGMTQADAVALDAAPMRGCFFNHGWRDSNIPYVRLNEWPAEVFATFTDERAAVDPAFAHCS
jgi:hypothetical protein